MSQEYKDCRSYRGRVVARQVNNAVQSSESALLVAY
jgi:hypothetical protein